MNRTMITLVAAMSSAACALAQTHDIRFEGGTAKEYYNELRESIPGLRLVVGPDVDYFTMPAVDLHDISTWAAVSIPSKLVRGIETDVITADETYIVRVEPGAIEYQERQPSTFDLEFPGGSLRSFALMLKEEADANIVLTPSVEGVPIAPMTLRRTTVRNIITTLGVHSERLTADGQELSLDYIENDENANTLYLIGPAQEHHQAPAVIQRVETWAIGEVISRGQIGADDVISAIDAAEDFFADEVTVRYHEGTRVLIARGVAEDLRVIDRLISRIEESSHFMDEQH